MSRSFFSKNGYTGLCVALVLVVASKVDASSRLLQRFPRFGRAMIQRGAFSLQSTVHSRYFSIAETGLIPSSKRLARLRSKRLARPRVRRGYVGGGEEAKILGSALDWDRYTRGDLRVKLKNAKVILGLAHNSTPLFSDILLNSTPVQFIDQSTLKNEDVSSIKSDIERVVSSTRSLLQKIDDYISLVKIDDTLFKDRNLLFISDDPLCSYYDAVREKIFTKKILLIHEMEDVLFERSEDALDMFYYFTEIDHQGMPTALTVQIDELVELEKEFQAKIASCESLFDKVFEQQYPDIDEEPESTLRAFFGKWFNKK